MIDRVFLRRNGPAVAVAIAALAVFTLLVALHGVPVLRHDWNFPISRATQASAFQSYFEGWSPTGFGEPHAYPTAFLFGLLLLAASAVLSPLAILVATLVGVGAAVLFFSWRLVRLLGGTTTSALASALFALYNPWVYTEIVAGHVTMIAAYAGTLGIVAELISRRERSLVLAILTAVVALQIQFGLLVNGFLFARAFARRDWLLLSSILVWTAPCAIGVLAYWGTIAGTPYLTSWQFQQSIDPGKLPFFGGYFTGYADALIDQARPALLIIAVLAAVGSVISLIERRAAALVVIIAGLMMLSTTGSKGPCGELYDWTVRHIPETGVFRELFDVVAFGVIAYLVAINAVTRRNRIAQFAFCLAVLGLCAAWINHPPAAFWPASSVLPKISASEIGHSRFALFPPFQPLMFDGLGSGVDPDAFERDGAVPINTSVPSFPVDVALARYALSGATDDLGALGVDRIIGRLGYHVDVRAVSHVVAGSLSAINRVDRSVLSQNLKPAPYVATVDRIVVSSLANRVGHNVIFVGDLSVADARAFGLIPVETKAVEAPRRVTDPTEDWVDARLSFGIDPDVGQAFGGAYTSSALPFNVLAGDAALVLVRGRLESLDHRWFIDTTKGYRWIVIPNGVDLVRCRGTCAIALQARTLPSAPLEPTPVRSRSVADRRVAPWLVIAHIPREHGPLLTLNERYNPGWAAVSSLGIFRHVRVDTTVNGWLLESGAGTVYLVQIIAASQFVLELCAAIWLGALCAHLVIKANSVRVTT